MKKAFIRATVCLTVFFAAISCDLRAQTVDISTAKVQKMQGLYVFCDSEPVAPYELLGTVKRNTGGFGGSQYTDVREGLIKQLKKEYPEANGIILYLVSGSADKADAIKFK